MTPELQAAIKAHAFEVFPNEACGFVCSVNGELVAVPTHNIAEKPTDYFTISAQAFLDAKQTGGLVGYYHSHPVTTSEFSDTDKAVAEKVLLPLYVYSVPQDAFNTYVPSGYVAPLEGRVFELGSYDCAGLVIDYYRSVLKITLGEFSRPGAFVVEGFPDIATYLKVNSLQAVSIPRIHDIILMRIGSSGSFCNHAGVFADEGVMLHQLLNTKSARVVYGGYWKASTRHFLRHKSQL
jgi:proteasome lid subunit RPN8/RPN11